MIAIVKLFLLIVTFVAARQVSDEELYRLPKLFHLDEYDRCLSQENGVYCLGTFELSSKTENNSLYSLIKEHLKEPFSFDRRLLHRGYCLSTRCPSKESNSTLRFEQCVDKLLRKYSLTARLKKLSYCRNSADRKARETETPDLPQRMFLYVIYLILFLNVLGTFYDLNNDGKKNNLLMAWSFPSNWKRLTAPDYGSFSAFAPIQSSKVILHFLIIYSHSTLLHYMSYVYNPQTLQKTGHNSLYVTIRNGTSVVSVFMLITSFFTGYHLLVKARRSTVDAGVVFRMALKRIFRIAPIYLLVTAYAATWWPKTGDGPLWSPMVEDESLICRKKFWTHALFVNNLVDASELCMVQSWAMAADIQLFLMSALLILMFLKLRVRAVPALVVLFTASCLFNVILAYTAGLVPMVKIIVPETMRVIFRGSRSFFHLHMSPWSNLPACLFGLLVAHIFFEQQNKIKAKTEDVDVSEHDRAKKHSEQVNENGKPVSENDKVNGSKKENNGFENNENGKINRKFATEHLEINGVDRTAKIREWENKINGVNSEERLNEQEKSNEMIGNQNASHLVEKVKYEKRKAPFLLRYAHCFTFPSLWLWVFLGSHIENIDSKLVIALFVGMERLLFSLVFAWQHIQIVTIKGPWGRFLGWRGWTVPGRLMICVIMVHWCVNVTIAAARPQPVASSSLYITMDWLMTLIFSYIIALPMHLLLELPVKKLLDVLIS